MAHQNTMPPEQMQSEAVIVQNLLRALNAMLCVPGCEDEQALVTEMAISHAARLNQALDRVNA